MRALAAEALIAGALVRIAILPLGVPAIAVFLRVPYFHRIECGPSTWLRRP